MDKTLEMSVFVEVVEAGSFVAAAERLRLSKSATSRHMDALENRLGVRLLQRTTRRLSLTDEGRTFYRRAKDLLSALEDAELEISARNVEASGTMRINAPVSFGIHHLASLWPAFMQQHPQVALDITLNDRVVDLFEEGYDLAVRIGQLPSSSMISRKLASTRMQLCATAQYLARHGTPEHPNDLIHHQVLSYSNWAARDEWPFEGPEGKVSVRTRPRVHSNNGDTCLAIALEHGGILLQPSFLVHDELAKGRLCELLPEYRSLELGVYALYPTRKQLSLKVRRLVDFLADALKDAPWSH